VRFSIGWLQRGSREVFGTVVEDVIYLLIDTSLSMQHHMTFVKDKIFQLFQVPVLACSSRNISAGLTARFDVFFEGGGCRLDV